MPERTSQPGEPRRPTLDELLDRTDPGAPADVERLTKGNERARRHVAMQAQVDAALRRAFAEPESVILPPLAVSSSQGRRLIRWAPWAAAAAVLLVALGAWRMWTVANRPDVLGPLYRQTVAAGFVPETVCTTDEEFAGWCRAYLRQPLFPTSRPEGLQYVGWNKGRVISPISGILLVRVEGQPVIVVLERSDRQTVTPGRIAEPGLNTFSRRIGDVVLYEITPRDKASVLPMLAAQPKR